MACYFIAQIRISDPVEYQKYLDGVDEIFNRYDGKYLVVSDSPVVLEGQWPYTRVVVIRFPDERELRRWYESEEYRELLQHRLKAAECDTVIVNGCE